MRRMAKLRILIIDPIHDLGVQGLRDAGFEVRYCPDITPQLARQQLIDCQGLIVRGKLPIDGSVLSHAPHLRFVARAGAGLEGIDQMALANRGIALLSTPMGNRDTLAEHCLGLLLALLHQIVEANAVLKSGEWVRRRFTGVELAAQTVGILGYGNMGSAFATRVVGMGCGILVHDRCEKKPTHTCIEMVSLVQLFACATVLSVPISPRISNYN